MDAVVHFLWMTSASDIHIGKHNSSNQENQRVWRISYKSINIFKADICCCYSSLAFSRTFSSVLNRTNPPYLLQDSLSFLQPFKANVAQGSHVGELSRGSYFKFSAGIRGEAGNLLMMTRPPATSHLCLKDRVTGHSHPVIPLWHG